MFKQLNTLAKTLPMFALAGCIALTGCDTGSGGDDASLAFEVEDGDEDAQEYGGRGTQYLGEFDEPCLIFSFERHPQVRLDAELKLSFNNGQGGATMPLNLDSSDRDEVTVRFSDFGGQVDSYKAYLDFAFLEGDRNTGGGYFVRHDVRECW